MILRVYIALILQLESLDSKLVQRRRDGTLTGSGDKAKKVEELRKFADAERRMF
jgi:hypothetical protein